MNLNGSTGACSGEPGPYSKFRDVMSPGSFQMTARGELRARLIRCASTGSDKARAPSVTTSSDRTRPAVKRIVEPPNRSVGLDHRGKHNSTVGQYPDHAFPVPNVCNVELRKNAYEFAFQQTAWAAGVPRPYRQIHNEYSNPHCPQRVNLRTSCHSIAGVRLGVGNRLYLRSGMFSISRVSWMFGWHLVCNFTAR